jgi:hypothetical protein
MPWRSGNVAARTKSLWAKASECRHLALIVGSSDASEAYLRLARSYDALADATLRPSVQSPYTAWEAAGTGPLCPSR